MDKIGQIGASQQIHMSALFLPLEEKLAAKGALFSFLVGVGSNKRVASDEGIQ